MTIDPDGTVVSSSQHDIPQFGVDQDMAIPMIGMVLSVQPSDDKGNLSASVESDQRGYRHEATVLITSAGDSEPYLLLENVVIPPRARSNYDDYDEDLPLGVSAALDGSSITENWARVDPSLLDGDYCVVNFIGGNFDKPFIQNWWPHPKNKIDPATSGLACLTQFDPTKKRSRAFRRVNGVTRTVTKDGDVYVDTSQAGSKLDLSQSKAVRKEVTKGGSVQVDVKTGQQLELNWNPKVEGLKAGSNSQSQSREPDLPHLDHDKATKPPEVRSVDDTIVRLKKQEATISTGKMVIRCHEEGGGDGFFMATGDDGVIIGQGGAGEVLASLSISDGKIVLSTPDGDNVALSSDQILATTKSGASVSLQGSSAAINAASGISLNGGLAGSPIALAPELIAALNAMLAVLNTYLGKVGEAMDKLGQSDAGSVPAGLVATATQTLLTPPVALTYTSKLVTAK